MKVGSQETPGVTGKFGLGIQNEAEQRLIEFCQENALVIANNLQQHKTLHMDITRWSIPKSDWLYSLQPKMEKLYTVSKNKTGSWLWLGSAAKSLQSCPTRCDPIDGSPPGSPVPGSLQARTLERVAISFSSAGKWKVKVKFLSRIWLVATPWTAAYQAPPSMGFSRQEYWSGVPLPSLT